MARTLWRSWLAVSLALVPATADSAPLIDASTPAAIAKTLEATGSGWTSAEKGYGGPADGTWSYALGGQASWSDYRMTCRVDLVKPANIRGGMELGAFAVYHALAKLGGYEAAVIVRHTSPQKHYRVAISSLWKEIIIWRPTGGVVQVQSYPFEAGKSYELSVACRGRRLRVAVDGKEVIDWWDTADLVPAGRMGLARKEGEAYFSSLRVQALASQTQSPAPPHQPDFRAIDWHNGRWFFDGKEPVFVITNRNLLDNMKFMPGYRPIMYTFNFITDWSRFYPTRTTDIKVVEAGKRLVVDTVAVDPKTKSKITCTSHLVVTYDPATGMYNYDQDCIVDLPAGECEKVGKHWDQGDAVFLGGVGSADTRDPQAFRALYQWSVFQSDDGKHYKVPMNHNGHYLGASSTNGGPLKSDGGTWVVVGDPVVSPVVKIRGLTDRFTKTTCGHCWWAYDMHTNFYPKLVAGKLLPGRYVTKVGYAGLPADQGNKLLAEATFYRPGDLKVRIPVYTAGMGFTERFDKEVLLASPHQEHRIWAGVIDKTIGYADKRSLRLDGPSEAWTLTGHSYFMGQYGKRNLVTAMVKTKDVQGDGPTIGFRRWDNNYGEFYPTGITGTTDWTKIAFVTDGPIQSWGVFLFFRNGGTGTVWIDDFKIKPLPENANPDVPVGRRYPLDPKDPDVVLHWNGRGDAGGVLDDSGYGHHGKFHGTAKWSQEDGRRAIVLDGKASYVWPLSSPNLTLGPPTTMVLDLKPEAPGYLLFWGWNFFYQLTGHAPNFGISYQLHSGKPVTSKPFLTAGKWQKLVIVADDGQIRLYRDGKFIESMPADLRLGDWGLHNISTWHRHLSFFGSGRGDMPRYERGFAGLKGKLGSLAIYKRALD